MLQPYPVQMAYIKQLLCGQACSHQMRVEHPSMSCGPSAQHSCNAEAVPCINDAHPDLLVIKDVMTPTLACRVVLTSMHV